MPNSSSQFYPNIFKSACGILHKETDSAMQALVLALEASNSVPFFIDAICSYANENEIKPHLISLAEMQRVFNAHIEAKRKALQDILQGGNND